MWPVQGGPFVDIFVVQGSGTWSLKGPRGCEGIFVKYLPDAAEGERLFPFFIDCWGGEEGAVRVFRKKFVKRVLLTSVVRR